MNEVSRLLPEAWSRTQRKLGLLCCRRDADKASHYPKQATTAHFSSEPPSFAGPLLGDNALDLRLLERYSII
jgi:hypothetical protein